MFLSSAPVQCFRFFFSVFSALALSASRRWDLSVAFWPAPWNNFRFLKVCCLSKNTSPRHWVIHRIRHSMYSPVSDLIVVPKAGPCLCGEPDLGPCPCLNHDQAWARPRDCCSLVRAFVEKKNNYDLPTVSLSQSRIAESLINMFSSTVSTMVNVCNSPSCNILQLIGACESASPARKWLNSWLRASTQFLWIWRKFCSKLYVDACT